MKQFLIILMVLLVIGCSSDKTPMVPDSEWTELKYELFSVHGEWVSARIVENTDGLIDVKWADSLGVFHEPFRFFVHSDSLYLVDLWKHDWVRMESFYGKYEE
ncbi:hypothetical protein EH221_07035 [bacterium]|nr:MAG: hypothetical protein EH221_07035 [bacterium]